LIEPDECTIVLILASIFELGDYYAISALANEIYQVLITFFPGLIHFVFVLVGVLDIILMLYVMKVV
jgi:hypothetical protein